MPARSQRQEGPRRPRVLCKGDGPSANPPGRRRGAAAQGACSAIIPPALATDRGNQRSSPAVRRSRTRILHPSSRIPHPSSRILPPASRISHPSALHPAPRSPCFFPSGSVSGTAREPWLHLHPPAAHLAPRPALEGRRGRALPKRCPRRKPPSDMPCAPLPARLPAEEPSSADWLREAGGMGMELGPPPARPAPAGDGDGDGESGGV